MIDSKLKQDSSYTLSRYLAPFKIASSCAEHIDTEDLSKCIMRLYRIAVNHREFNSFSDAIQSVLSLGCARFNSGSALVLRCISEQVYEIQSCVGEEQSYFVGQHLSVASSQIFQLHDEKRVVIEVDLSPVSSQNKSLAYNSVESRAYSGINFELGGSDNGVVCFMSSTPGECIFDNDDMVLMELMAEGIACMMDFQKARSQRKTDDLAIFASGSIKSLEEYQASSELVEGLGISGKVVDVLKRRLGQSSLSIDSVAEDLNLSKRTLQRRLQQNGVSFAELRDRVRFHYSIDFLVKQQISIDRISSMLDFSDRTSFTNAFKRWTGLSPSTFRKVFRDYA